MYCKATSEGCRREEAAGTARGRFASGPVGAEPPPADEVEDAPLGLRNKDIAERASTLKKCVY